MNAHHYHYYISMNDHYVLLSLYVQSNRNQTNVTRLGLLSLSLYVSYVVGIVVRRIALT